MFRRELLAGAAALALHGCRTWPGPELFNPCLPGRLPNHLAGAEVVLSALDGLYHDLYWDAHVHLIGIGDNDSGVWINPAMKNLLHPALFTRFRFFLNASCVDTRNVDLSYISRLRALQDGLFPASRLMLLAFDYTYDYDGRRKLKSSAFYTPNSYAARIAQEFPDTFEWIASIHPYRHDCIEALEQAVTMGARAVKWLPPAMGIDPGAAQCDRFYSAMKHYDLPLLVHAGEERAVRGANRTEFANPLLLRRPLEHGLRVIVAHCASLGSSTDIDTGRNSGHRSNFELFSRLMDEARYESQLYGEISAMTQSNRIGVPLETVIQREEWHHRLINGSDYPLPGVLPLFSLHELAARNYIAVSLVEILGEIRRHNALMFDLVLKRHLRVNNRRLHPIIFASRRVFDPDISNPV